jgi:predicted N-formylglutamate amidohydrolase
MQNIPILVSPATFSASSRELDAMGTAPVLWRAGAGDVLVTAVHAYGHLRNGFCKPRDSGTLQTSHVIAVAANADWMAVGEENAIDSNYHRETPFKDALAAHLAARPPRLVVDIHGSHALRPFDVEIGSIDQRSWLGRTQWRDALQQTLVHCGFFVSDNQVFRAAGATPEAQTITAFCMELGVPCVQLEICSALMDDLDTVQAMHANAKLVNAIAAVLATLPADQ